MALRRRCEPELDMRELDVAIAGLSDAVDGSETAHTAASGTQAGGSVVGAPSSGP